MKLVFIGTSSFVVPVLEMLLNQGHQVAGVYTLPDKPAGRGRRLRVSPVKEFALTRNLPLYQPAYLKAQEAIRDLEALSPEAIVVAAYGKILPKKVLDLPSLGCLNLHPSLLPRYRGPSPVASAILEGSEKTGVTVMLLDEGMDTGPILAQEETLIAPNENAETLTERLFHIGARLLIETLPLWTKGEIIPKPQDNAKATVSRLLTREDGLIDWTESAVTLWREVRAYCPWPGSYTFWRGKRLKVLEVSVSDESMVAEPGAVVTLAKGGLGVATGDGGLVLMHLQLEGRNPLGAKDLLRGNPSLIGSKLG